MNNSYILEKIKYKETLFPINFKFIQRIEIEDYLRSFEKFVKNPSINTDKYYVRSAYSPICKIIMPYD